MLPQAAQPPAVPSPVATPAGAPHKWTPAPGETFNTPDGSRPRSLDEVMGALRKANPKADPATLARAAGLYMPWLQEGDQVLLRQEMMKNTAAISGARMDTQRDIAAAKEAGSTDRTQMRIQAAQQRADQVNQRALSIAAQVNALGQAKLEEARRSGDGRAALAAQKELRLQQEGITRLQYTYSTAMSNAQYITDDAQKAAAVENATQALEQGLDAFRALPNPTATPDEPAAPDASGSPGRPAGPGAVPGSGAVPAMDNTDPTGAIGAQFGQQSMLRRPANSQLSLAQLNARRAVHKLPALPAIG
jgi:hypothetical protein